MWLRETEEIPCFISQGRGGVQCLREVSAATRRISAAVNKIPNVGTNIPCSMGAAVDRRDLDPVIGCTFAPAWKLFKSVLLCERMEPRT